MRGLFLYLVLTCVCCYGYRSFAETPSLSTPLLQTVEVMSDAAVRLQWHYDSSEVNDGFIIERWQYISDTLSSSINESSWKVIDTVGFALREYLDVAAHANVKKRIYRVKAFVYRDDVVCEGPPSNQMQTLWLSPDIVFDSCSESFRLRWTSFLEDYDVSYRLDVDGQELVVESANVVDSVPTYETSQGDFYTYIYEYVLNVNPFTQYSFYVKALMSDGRISTSNVVTPTSGSYQMPRLPSIICASVGEDNVVEVVLHDVDINAIDTLVVRRNGHVCYRSRPVDSVVSLFDESGTAQYSSVSYEASVLDCCGRYYAALEQVSTIFVEGCADESKVSLAWESDSHPWEATDYRIWRRLPEESHFSCIGTSVTASFVDNLDDGVLPAYHLYRVEQRGDDTLSVFSNTCRVTFESLDVRVPNAFIPGGVTPTFGPIFKAPPHSEYRFVVVNRDGLVLFQTEDYESRWDGTYAGQLVDTGAYLWQVSFMTSRGRPVFKQGSVLLLNK